MNRMGDTYPRLLGGMGLVWAVVLQRGALDWPSDPVWMAFSLAWLAASILLVTGRRTAPAALALACLAMAMFLGPGRDLYDPLALFWWLGLAVAVTDGRPTERALLVRVTVTVAYVFACLTKINPSFLSGEQLVALASERAQINWLEALFRTNVGLVVAWGTVLFEGAMAVALWFRPTRVVAAVVGTVMHVVFIYAAHNDTVWDLAYVTVLNLLLVISYLAFFSPIGPLRSERGEVADPRAAPDPEHLPAD